MLWRKKRKKIKPSHLLALATTLMINECCVLHLACLKTIKPWRFSKASFLGPTSKSLIFIFIFPPPCTSKNTDAHPHPDCPMTPDGGVHESHSIFQRPPFNRGKFVYCNKPEYMQESISVWNIPSFLSCVVLLMLSAPLLLRDHLMLSK